MPQNEIAKEVLEMSNDKVFCKVCSLVVAKGDPERIQRGLEVFHSVCYRKVRMDEDTRAFNARVSNARLVRQLRTVH